MTRLHWMRRGRWTTKFTGAVVVSAVALTACTHAAPATHPGTAPSAGSTGSAGSVTATPITVSGVRTLGGNERTFGTSVGNIPGAVYQPDVVVIGGGADSIVSAEDNGLVWTVRGNAPGADRLAVGKVMVATSFATGRVENLQSVQGNEQVTLAPVSLTDVFSELDVSSSAPVTLKTPLVYSYPDTPLTATDGDAGVTADPPPAPDSVRPVGTGPVIPSTIPSVPPSVTLKAPDISPKAVHEGKFDLIPYCCFPSQGVHISYNEPAGRMAATVGLVMNGEPLVDFHLTITLGGLQEAVFQLNGPKAIEFQFNAATKDVSGNYQSPTLRIPIAFSFPVGGHSVHGDTEPVRPCLDPAGGPGGVLVQG